MFQQTNLDNQNWLCSHSNYVAMGSLYSAKRDFIEPNSQSSFEEKSS